MALRLAESACCLLVVETRPQDFADAALKNPEYLVNGRWVDVISPRSFDPRNALNSATMKVRTEGQTQRVVIALESPRTNVSVTDLEEAWAALKNEQAGNDLAQVLGYQPDPSGGFPLEELVIMDLDAADPLDSIVKLFSE